MVDNNNVLSSQKHLACHFYGKGIRNRKAVNKNQTAKPFKNHKLSQDDLTLPACPNYKADLKSTCSNDDLEIKSSDVKKVISDKKKVKSSDRSDNNFKESSHELVRNNDETDNEVSRTSNKVYD